MAISLATKFISELGNSSGSILPIWVKDTTQDTITTLVYSKKGGAHDGKEKAIEEYGTGLVWVFGIPVIKKFIDKTAYKIAKINPNFEIQKLQKGAQDSLEYSIEKAKIFAKDQLPDLEKVAKNKSLTKGLFVGKFAVATLATMGLLGSLIHLKQKTTEDDIKKQIIKNGIIQDNINKDTLSNNVFNSFAGKNQKQLSFKGIPFAQFMYNPVNNMMILDTAISTTRLAKARKGEKGEVLIKEGAFWALMYGLADPIQKGLEKLSSKLFKTPISLDYKVLADDEFIKSVADGSLKGAIDKFKTIKDEGTNILDYMWENKGDTLVKMLKKTGAVPSTKDGNINALKFMQKDKILGSVQKMEEYIKSSTLENVEKFAKKAKGLKIASTFVNIGIAVAILGLLIPSVSILRRKLKSDGDRENPAVKEVENKVKKQCS